MTAVHEPFDLLEMASSDDRTAAVDDALTSAGFTYDELAEQARAGDFKTFNARLAWVVVGGSRARR